MKERVYIETSIISYLMARDSRDVVQIAKQQLTREWWDSERSLYTLFISQPVLDEIRRGDPNAGKLRMAAVEHVQLLPVTAKADALVDALLRSRVIPASAKADAYHVGVAAANGVDFLLTWNCTHINNSHTLGRMAEVIARAGFTPPVIATPETLRRKRT